MKKTWRIDPSAIPDVSFHRVLVDLAETGSQLAVCGGAVRNLLFFIVANLLPSEMNANSLRYERHVDSSSENILGINDIDIAAILDSVPQGEVNYREFSSLRVLPMVRERWSPICRRWRKRTTDFSRLNNTKVRGIVHPVGMMGLRTVYDKKGNAYPDYFATKSLETFNAVPMCLSINCFAIDGRGLLYGPLGHIEDFANRTARIMRPAQYDKYLLPLLLRTIKDIKRFNLTCEPETKAELTNAVKHLMHSPKLLQEALGDIDTQKLLAKFSEKITEWIP